MRLLGYRELPGWFDWEWLYAEWAQSCCATAVFVEVGVYLGRSLAFMCEQLEDKPRVQVWGVDNWAVDQVGTIPHWEGWGGDAWHEMAGNPREECIRIGGPFNSFTTRMHDAAPEALERSFLLRMQSARAARVFDDASVDFVYIDAEHKYDSVRADIHAWLPKVRPGGKIAGHDYGMADVSRAVHETFGESIALAGATWVKQL